MVNKVIVSEMPTSPFIDNAEVLGKLIEAKRTGVGLKLADFAETCGISQKTFNTPITLKDIEHLNKVSDNILARTRHLHS